MKRMTDDPSKARHISLSQTQQADLRTDYLGEKLNVMIGNLPASGVSLAEIRDIVGQDGLLLLIAFLAIVFMVPVSIPGVSKVFGAAILMIGTSRLLDCKLWLPKYVAQHVLPAEKLRTGLQPKQPMVASTGALESSPSPELADVHLASGNTEQLRANNCVRLAYGPFWADPFQQHITRSCSVISRHWTVAARWSLHPVRASCQPLRIYSLYRHHGRRQSLTSCAHKGGNIQVSSP